MPRKKQVIEVDSLPVNIVTGATYSIQQSNPNSYTHGMFKYPCKFIPEIPRWAIRSYALEENSVVFDPFSGSGTTLLEANLSGLNAYGAEIDDIAKLIIGVKTNILSVNQFELLDVEYNNIMQAISCEESQRVRPSIDNLTHWFSEEAINALGAMRYCIDNIEDQDVRNFFKVCMVSIIKKVSMADDTSPKPYVSKKIIKAPPPVEKEFASVFRRYKQMMSELIRVGDIGCTHIVEGDALSFSLPMGIDLAITSPPYINAFDYGRAMRLENLWMGTLNEADLRNKKSRYVGTEKIKVKEEVNNLDILKKSDLLKKYYDRIKAKDEKRALIVKKFFEDMESNLISVYENLNADGKYVIVIGNSNIRQVKIESWKVIEDIANSIGFRTVQYFNYVIQNPYIRIPRKGKGGEIDKDYVLVLEK